MRRGKSLPASSSEDGDETANVWNADRFQSTGRRLLDAGSGEETEEGLKKRNVVRERRPPGGRQSELKRSTEPLLVDFRVSESVV